MLLIVDMTNNVHKFFFWKPISLGGGGGRVLAVWAWERKVSSSIRVLIAMNCDVRSLRCHLRLDISWEVQNWHQKCATAFSCDSLASGVTGLPSSECRWIQWQRWCDPLSVS